MAITKLLVANRGEIARRVMRTCRAMGIDTVAVYSDADADAPFVHEADDAVPIGGAAPGESYLRGDAVVAAALRVGADGVHPGYGFLSENAPFAQRVIDAGLTWVGPPPSAIEAMGSKLAAREMMIDAGVRVVPGADLTDLSDDKLLAVATGLGLPVLVKASFGGGGRGMRLVREGEDLVAAVASARREAGSAFGADTVYLERYIDAPRHIEIQIMGDTHGNVVDLFERECSIQRRHQKIIEEAPSPYVTAELRRAMGDAAIAAARAVGYVGAGTVEFIVAPTGEFFFLEMNTRLQVEHPVTELITGIDLVRVQLLVAQGDPLPDEVMHATMRGHAIEARLYAEDPDHDYLPSPGRLHRFRVPAIEGVRVDSAFDDDGTVSPHYDPMLAKVIAYAPTRIEAAQKLAWALRRTQTHGVATNRELLVGVLEHREFREGAIDTHFLERHPPASLRTGHIDDDNARVAAVAAALAASHEAHRRTPVLAAVPAGWRNNPSQLHSRAYDSPAGELRVGYSLGREPRFEVNGEALAGVAVVSVAADHVALLVDGVRRTFSVHMVDDEVYVDTPRGSLVLREQPRFPQTVEKIAAGSLVAPMPGTVVSVEVAVGDQVVAGQLLAVLEAMKMEHQITAPVAGRVSAVLVTMRQTIDAGTVMVVIEAEAP
ncbi:MAG: biotin carboxylase N-terminal domain-containing protein [Acidimicrobiales bacterium]